MPVSDTFLNDHTYFFSFYILVSLETSDSLFGCY